jgi:hypothetical protein
MGAAALPVCGIWLGYSVLEGARIAPFYEEDVALLGFRLMVASVICFIGAMATFVILWIKDRATGL